MLPSPCEVPAEAELEGPRIGVKARDVEGVCGSEVDEVVIYCCGLTIIGCSRPAATAGWTADAEESPLAPFPALAFMLGLPPPAFIIAALSM